MTLLFPYFNAVYGNLISEQYTAIFQVLQIVIMPKRKKKPKNLYFEMFSLPSLLLPNNNNNNYNFDQTIILVINNNADGAVMLPYLPSRI